MEIGDVVRLKHPFSPNLNSLKAYCYGVVVGWVPWHDTDLPSPQPQPKEVIVHLYDAETRTFYTDEFGIQPMFYFRLDELED